MQRKSKKFVLFSVILIISILFSRCQNEEYVSNSENKNLRSAKTWFNKYKEKEEFHPAFENIDYYWQNANIEYLENGSVAIAVPMKDNPENPDYKGKKILYLYPTDNGYDAVVHETFPKSEAVSNLENKNEGFKNLDSFSGYILTWNLKEGFVKGAEFENGLIVKNIPFAMIYSENKEFKTYNTTHKAPPAPPLELDPVVVTGGTGGGGCGGCSGIIRFTPTIGGGMGGGTGGYIGSPNGGGSSISAPTPAQIIDALTGKAKCLNDLLSKNGNTFVQKLLANFEGTSKFNITIVSKEEIFSQKLQDYVDGQTSQPVNNMIEIRISISKANSNSALSTVRTILHEYIHADIYRKLNTKYETQTGELDFNKTFETYNKDHHETMAVLYINSMKEALKSFHKNVLSDDYNKYTKYYEEEPSDEFYEAMAWQGLSQYNLQAWNNLNSSKKEEFKKLWLRARSLTSSICPN